MCRHGPGKLVHSTPQSGLEFIFICFLSVRTDPDCFEESGLVDGNIVCIACRGCAFHKA